MKKVEKFSTFYALKSSENETLNYSLTLKKHADFEEFLKEIMLSKPKKTNKNTANH